MSTPTQVAKVAAKMKKNELAEALIDSNAKVKEMEKYIGTLTDDKNETKSDTPHPVDNSTALAIDNLMQENERLKEHIRKSKKTEQFVGIESLVDAIVWLPAPESRSGNPSDREKGRMLRRKGDIQIIPAYWMVDYVANNSLTFIMGDVRVNNDRAKMVNPALSFADINIPTEFKESAIDPGKIESIVAEGGERLQRFVENYSKNPFVLSKIMQVVDNVIESLADTDMEKALLNGVTENITMLLNPKVEEEEDS